MDLSQVIVLAVLAIGIATYVARSITRRTRADEEFFVGLVDRLMEVLEPKGLRYAGPFDPPKAFSYRIATFEGATFVVEAAWDGREREVSLVQRVSRDTGSVSEQRLAVAHVPDGAVPAVFAHAADVIVAAASTIGVSNREHR